MRALAAAYPVVRPAFGLYPVDAEEYEQLKDAAAEAEGWVRVVDESGEDYLYPSKYFLALDLPQAAMRALANGRRRSTPRSA